MVSATKAQSYLKRREKRNSGGLPVGRGATQQGMLGVNSEPVLSPRLSPNSTRLEEQFFSLTKEYHLHLLEPLRLPQLKEETADFQEVLVR